VKRGRLEAVAERWSLDAAARGRLERLLALVHDDPRAATSVRDPEEAAFIHVADSLSGLPLLADSGPIADVGSGAGFPGLPLAIALPNRDLDLIESARRKTAFLEDAVQALGLECARVVTARAEEWAVTEGRERYGSVVIRAVDALATLIEYASPLLVQGGRLVAWKGARDRDEETAAEVAAEALGMAAAGVEHVTPYAGSRDHNLHLYEKVRPTPPGYPRRAGMARKRPLG
jgi:16S rRNA (guanine527-N7)-methyltransferase